ncbi:hypothetical protein [Pedobacter nanyangensis]|uniref:hypothetical protein n=1 Tax=Pedobacter nanyangensis TaxID=1562389 RepID=UPI0013B41C70|nr:hypothetical protein [Pedobacter nanyangensis]
MKKSILTLILLAVYSAAFAQKSNPDTEIKKLGPKPFFVVNDKKATTAMIKDLPSDSVTVVTLLYDTAATNRYGDAAKDGLVMIETRSYAKSKFISYFKKVSPEFDQLYTSQKNDQNFVYILNDKIQKGNYEGNLSTIGDKEFIKLEIISAEQLKTNYNIEDKQYGIVVQAIKPEEKKEKP